MTPREHGAYGQLGLPLIVALSSGRPTFASVLLTAAALGAFFAHEPMRVALGHRGTKAMRIDGSRALVRALSLGAAALAMGIIGLVLSPAARSAALFVAPAIALVAILVSRNADRTPAGESAAGVALAGAGVPVAVASGVPVAEALAAWFVWGFGFVATTLAVRAVTSRSPLERTLDPWLVLAIVAIGAAAFVHGFGIVLAAAPLGLVTLALVVAKPAAKHLRRVGWALMFTLLATGAGLVLHARA